MLRNIRLLNYLYKNNLKLAPVSFQIEKNYASAPKRFYKNAGVLYSDGKYEITLDNKKLKTPNGTPFFVNSEPLAMAVATEWELQKDSIIRSNMHLTSICNTAIDNPNHLKKEDIVNYLLNYIPTDTVLFQSSEDDDLYKYQCDEWDPVIEWFNSSYETDLIKCRDITSPVLSPNAKMAISKHIMSYSLSTLHGYVFAVDTVKSIVLAFACIDRFISVERAIHLSRLEEEFQLKHWGRVEWAHDFSQHDLQARLAAAVLFVHFTSTQQQVKQKGPS